MEHPVALVAAEFFPLVKRPVAEPRNLFLTLFLTLCWTLPVTCHHWWSRAFVGDDSVLPVA